MHSNPLISVIIPVYNVERYLPECMDSVLGQTYTNLEIFLVVDDSSPDNCPQMCDEYAAQDNRVKVIHKPCDLSGARNAGLDACTGGYVTFIDSDDWVSRDMIEIMYRDLAANDADISHCGKYRAYVGLNVSNPPPPQPYLMTREQAVVRLLTRGFPRTAYAYLYRKSIFDNIRYPVGRSSEDVHVIFDIFMAADKIFVNNLPPMYYYRQRRGSLARKGSDVARLAEKLETFDEFRQRIDEKCPQYASMSQAFLYRQYDRILSKVFSDTGCRKSVEGRRFISSTIVKLKKDAKSLVKNAHLTKKEKAMLRLLVINTQLYKTVRDLLCSTGRMKKRIGKIKKSAGNRKKILFD